MSGTFSNNNLAAGAFTDSFSFVFPTPGLGAATISSIFSTNRNNNVDFTSVTLNGAEFTTVSTGAIEFRYLNNLPIAGGLQTLLVNGLSGGNGSYAGALAFESQSARPSPSGSAVPEPATWAMMLLGFGVVGFAMRKRSHVRTTVSYA